MCQITSKALQAEITTFKKLANTVKAHIKPKAKAKAKAKAASAP